MYTRILIPLDGSKTAEKVLPYARYLAGSSKFQSSYLVLSISPRWPHKCQPRRHGFSIQWSRMA